MAIFAWSRRSFQQQQARQAVEIARACQGEVYRRVRLRLAELVLAEARGYIRARSGRLVAEELKRRLGPVTATGGTAKIIHELAVRTLIEGVLAEHVRDIRRIQSRIAA